jgi:RNA polymerase sigma-70 factor (ECF subfamily)
MSYALTSHSNPGQHPARSSADASSHTNDAGMIAVLRRRDENALGQLIEHYQGALLRTAMTYVASLAVAEEVVQETWISVLQSLDRFEGRCSLKTWIFRILTNRAKARGVREARSVPFSALRRLDDDAGAPASSSNRVRSIQPAMDHDSAQLGDHAGRTRAGPGKM